MAKDVQESKPDKAPNQEAPAQSPKPRKPLIPSGHKPGVGIGGIASVKIPKIRPEFEPRTGGAGIMPDRIKDSE